MSKVLSLLTALMFAVILAPRDSYAVTINEDAGWVAGTVSNTTDVLAFDFTLSSAGVFSLTDCCNIGDTWTISGDFAGVSTVGLASVAVPLGIGAFSFILDGDWLDPLKSHFQLALAAGTYSIFVTGNGGGGFPASVGVRLDTIDTSVVPIPGAGILLLTGLGGLAVLRQRRRKIA